MALGVDSREIAGRPGVGKRVFLGLLRASIDRFVIGRAVRDLRFRAFRRADLAARLLSSGVQ